MNLQATYALTIGLQMVVIVAYVRAYLNGAGHDTLVERFAPAVACVAAALAITGWMLDRPVAAGVNAVVAALWLARWWRRRPPRPPRRRRVLAFARAGR